MAHVFISYARSDKPRVEGILNGLRAAKVDFFYDRSINVKENWEKRLDAELSKASVVLVIWSRNSKKSDQVLRELQVASDLGLDVVQILIDRGLEIPYPYGYQNAADLTRWTGGDFADLHWRQVVDRVGGVHRASRKIDQNLATENYHDRSLRRAFQNYAFLSVELSKLLNCGFVLSDLGDGYVVVQLKRDRKSKILNNIFRYLFGRTAKLYSEDSFEDPVLQVLEVKQQSDA